MDNNETAQVQNESILDKDEYQELTKLMNDALILNLEDKRKVEEMESLYIGESTKPDWNSFSIMAMRGLLHGYENGELSFEKMMKIAWNCALPLRCANLGFHAMGALAAIATKIKPKERYAKKPPIATWVKKAAVEYALLVKEAYPNLKISPNRDGETAKSIPFLTLEQLGIFDLNIGEGGNPLTEKTIYEWICEYKRENNPPQDKGIKEDCN